MFKFVVKRNTTELFHRAVADNDVLRVKLLLEQTKEDTKFSINGINNEGLTALQTSCFAGNLDIVKLLVKHGANIKIKDRDGWTLLHAAAMAGKLDIVEYLVENGLSVSLRNDRKQLPLDFAEDLPVVMFILKQMLSEGLDEDVHRFIKRNPQLKKEIYKEVELAIHMKKQEIKALERLPYTPQDRKKRNSSDSSKNAKINNNNMYSKPKQNNMFHRENPHNKTSPLPHSRKSPTSPVSPGLGNGKYFTLDVDDLPPTPSTLGKRWSSMSNIPTNFERDFSEVKIHMHNGYETDGTETLLNNCNELGNKSARERIHHDQGSNSQSRTVEVPEIDIASVNSHSTSGYETDDVDPQLFLHHAKTIIHSDSDHAISQHYYHDHEQYQRKSKTLSPRTVRRLEHRFGSLAMGEPEFEFGKNQSPKKSKNLKRVEYPEVFL